MGLLDRFRFRLQGVRRTRFEEDVDEELRFHLTALTDEYRAKGLSEVDAERAARRDFGVTSPFVEQMREVRGVSMIEAASQDVRYGTRLLIRNPGFACAAILTVGLGIAATTAVFSVVYGVLWSPLPYAASDRLVSLWTQSLELKQDRMFVGAADYRDWRTQQTVFEDIALVRTVGNFTMVGGGEPERVQGSPVTASLFRVLKVEPALGRVFRDEEERPGNDAVVILSDGLWARRFGRDPGVLSRSLALSGRSYSIIGVMPPSFAYPGREFDLWVPLTVNPADYENRLSRNYRSVARLKPGVSVEQARAEMRAIASRLGEQYPDSNAKYSVTVFQMLDDMVQPVRASLFVLIAAVASLLLIGCASLGNLLLARASGRTVELTLRGALGASRGRLVRQALAELVPLVVAGGTVGILLAAWVLAIVRPRLATLLPRVDAIALNGPVLLMAFAAVIFTSALAGVWPALQQSRQDAGVGLRDGARGGTGSRRVTRLRDAFVVAQVMTAVALAVGAALFVRSFAAVQRVDVGFQTKGVLGAHLQIPRTKYPLDQQVAAFSRQIVNRVQTVPGVESVGMVNRLPLAGGGQNGFLELENSQLPGGRIESVDWRSVTPDYFRTMSIPVRRGRAFTDGDHETAPPVGIIDERLAALAWPGQDPIGRRFRIPFPGQPWITVVGVVGHIRHDGVTVDTRPQVYWHYLQRAQDRMALVVRGKVPPERLVADVVASIRAIDPEQPVYDVQTLDALRDRAVVQPRITTYILVAFAVTALLLACVGIYGVTAYSVGQRTREVALRIALGARPSNVLMLVLRHTAILAACGVFLGLIVVLASGRLIRTVLYGIAPTDWVSFGAASLLLSLVVFAAAVIPVRRALRIDPMLELRN